MAIAFPIPRIRPPCYPPRIREQDDDVIVVKISAIRIRWISMSPFDRVLLQSYVRKICILFFLTRKIQGWIVKRTKYQEIVYPTLKWLNLGETRLMKSGEERERRLTLKRRDICIPMLFLSSPLSYSIHRGWNLFFQRVLRRNFLFNRVHTGVNRINPRNYDFIKIRNVRNKNVKDVSRMKDTCNNRWICTSGRATRNCFLLF